ncbi:MAG: hypothetical protein IT566_08775 [Rhodospirillaceae bacterium]|nr:hypothetical protein [Rhodospirillaceae bacterium]
MATAKKKAAQKPAGKAAKKKTSPKRAPATKKSAAKKRVSKKRAVKKSAAGGVRLGVPLDLDARLRNLAVQMDLSLEEVLIQAMSEFADNWEDHLLTVRNLNAGDDRMQLSVPDDDNTP